MPVINIKYLLKPSPPILFLPSPRPPLFLPSPPLPFPPLLFPVNAPTAKVSRRRLGDCAEELQNLLVQEKLAGASLLVFANKQVAYLLTYTFLFTPPAQVSKREGRALVCAPPPSRTVARMHTHIPPQILPYVFITSVYHTSTLWCPAHGCDRAGQ